MNMRLTNVPEVGNLLAPHLNAVNRASLRSAARPFRGVPSNWTDRFARLIYYLLQASYPGQRVAVRLTALALPSHARTHSHDAGPTIDILQYQARGELHVTISGGELSNVPAQLVPTFPSFWGDRRRVANFVTEYVKNNSRRHFWQIMFKGLDGRFHVMNPPYGHNTVSPDEPSPVRKAELSYSGSRVKSTCMCAANEGCWPRTDSKPTCARGDPIILDIKKINIRDSEVSLQIGQRRHSFLGPIANDANVRRSLLWRGRVDDRAEGCGADASFGRGL